MAEVRKQPVEKSCELLGRSEFLSSRDRDSGDGVISIEKKRGVVEERKRKAGRRKGWKHLEATGRDGWEERRSGRMGAQSGSQNHRQSRREKRAGMAERT